jgi:hypothetical protein
VGFEPTIAVLERAKTEVYKLVVQGKCYCRGYLLCQCYAAAIPVFRFALLLVVFLSAPMCGSLRCVRLLHPKRPALHRAGLSSSVSLRLFPEGAELEFWPGLRISNITRVSSLPLRKFREETSNRSLWLRCKSLGFIHYPVT